MATNNMSPGVHAKIRLTTKHFGDIEVDAEQIIHLPQGLLGFPDFHRYILIEHKKGSPFLWFQCVDNPELVFAVIDPQSIMSDYQTGKLNGSLVELEAEGVQDLQLFVIVTIPKGRPKEMTANLIGPLAINLKNRRAKQLILDNPNYSHRHRLIP